MLRRSIHQEQYFTTSSWKLPTFSQEDRRYYGLNSRKTKPVFWAQPYLPGPRYTYFAASIPLVRNIRFLKENKIYACSRSNNDGLFPVLFVVSHHSPRESE